jgi:C4-dicarboxylate-specific signal transduction histidine kinase
MLQPYIAKIAVAGWLVAVLLGAALWVQTARHSEAAAAIDTAETALDNCIETADGWEKAAGDLRARLNAEVEARRVDRQRDEAAVLAAEAAKRDADRTLRAWLDRYAAATTSAECAAVERMVVCEVPE